MKIGDTVKVVNPHYMGEQFKGKVGILKNITLPLTYPYHVMFSNDITYNFKFDELEVING